MTVPTSPKLRPAVVLNMFPTGLAIARNLGRHGVPVIGVSSLPSAPGNRSRYCRPLLGPDSQNEPERLVRFLTELARTIPARPILFPTRDADVLFLDRHRDRLGPLYVLPQPSGDRLDRIMNKHRLAAHAVAHGIPTPRTIRLASRSELEHLRGTLVFPIVVKPAYAAQWRDPDLHAAVGGRKAVKVETPANLDRLYAHLEPHRPDVLLQEWIPGDDDECYIFGAYRDRRGTCRGWFTARKLVQYPPEFGLGCVVRLAANEAVRALGDRLLESLEFFGTAEVEFKRDPATGRYLLIEVNPRHWDQHALGLLCGVNLSLIAYQDLSDVESGPPIGPRAADGYWISGRGLLASVKEDLRRGQIRPRKLRGLLPWPGTRFALWDVADPAPSIRWIPSPRARTGGTTERDGEHP